MFTFLVNYFFMQFREHASLRLELTEVIKQSDLSGITVQLQTYNQEIFNLLTSYHYSERGSVQKSQIIPESVIIASGEAVQFETAYKTQHRYACDGITHEYDHTMKIRLEINQVDQKLTFIGEDWPERDGDEF